MLSPEDLAYLRGLSVFAGLRGEVVDTIGRHAKRVEVAAAEVLFREGDPARDMLVVLTGCLEVVKHGKGGAEALIATLHPGDVAGEMSLVDIQPRSADVRSAGPASVAMLSHADIASVYREDHEAYTLLLLNISREISLRLRRLDNLLADIMLGIQEVTKTSTGSRGNPTMPTGEPTR